MEIILTIILTLVITTSFFIIRNLLKKNETLEDFITKQSDAVNACDIRLKEIDNKDVMHLEEKAEQWGKTLVDINLLDNLKDFNFWKEWKNK